MLNSILYHRRSVRGGTLAVLVSLALAASSSVVQAEPIPIAEVKRDTPVDFAKDILPILRKNCLACHNKTDAESDLVLETPDAILKGGLEGPSVVAHKPDESLMLQVAAYKAEPVMPPADNKVGAKKFTPEELGLLKLWIEQGAQVGSLATANMVNWQPLPPGVNPIYALAVSPDGQTVAASRANQVFLYHVPSKRMIGRLTDPALLSTGVYTKPGVADFDLIQALRFRPDGDMLASGGYRNVKLWERNRNARSHEFSGLAAPALSVAVSADGKWAAIGEESGQIQLLDLTEGKVAETLAGHSGPVRGLAFTKENMQLVSTSDDMHCIVWNLVEKKEVGKLTTPSAIHAVALLDGDKRIATAGADQIIRVWEFAAVTTPPAADAAAPQPAVELKGHTGVVTSLASFGDASSRLVSGSEDGTARVWDVAGAKQVQSLAHGGPVRGVAARADGSRIASVGANNVAKLWAADGKQVVEFKGDFRARLRVDEATRKVSLATKEIDATKAELKAIQDRKDAEEKNATAAEEARKKAADELTAKEEATKKPVADHEAAMKSLTDAQAELAKAEEAKKTAEADLTKATEALTKATADLEAAQKAEPKNEDAIKAAEAAKAQAEQDKKKAEEAKAKAEEQIKANQENVKKAEEQAKKAKEPADKAIAERDAAKRSLESAERTAVRAKEAVQKIVETIPPAEETVKMAETAQTEVKTQLEAITKTATEAEKPLRAVAFSPDGLTVATTGDDEIVHTWDAETGVAIDSFVGQASTLTALAYLPNGQLLSTGQNATCFAWKTDPEWRLTRTIGSADDAETFTDRVTALDFSPDGTWLATGGGEPSRSGELKVWNVADGTLVKAIPDAHSDTIFGLEFSPDGKQLATGAADRFAKIFDIESGKLVRSFEGHTHHVLGVTWRADGRLLATSGADNAIKVWNVKTGEQSRTIAGFGKEVTGIRFLADGDNLVASSGDKSVQMKNAANGGNVRSFAGSNDFLYSVGASADGKMIAAGGQDSVLRLWTDNGTTWVNFEAPKAE